MAGAFTVQMYRMSVRLVGLTCISHTGSSQTSQESAGLLPTTAQERFRTMTGRMGLGPRYVFMILLLQRVYGLTVADASGGDMCKDVELKSSQTKSGMVLFCDSNHKDQDICRLSCPEGMTVNGKVGVSFKKLICKCGSKCKWKNEKNKKISRAVYQKWKSEGEFPKQPDTVS